MVETVLDSATRRIAAIVTQWTIGNPQETGAAGVLVGVLKDTGHNLGAVVDSVRAHSISMWEHDPENADAAVEFVENQW